MWTKVVGIDCLVAKKLLLSSRSQEQRYSTPDLAAGMTTVIFRHTYLSYREVGLECFEARSL